MTILLSADHPQVDKNKYKQKTLPSFKGSIVKSFFLPGQKESNGIDAEQKLSSKDVYTSFLLRKKYIERPKRKVSLHMSDEHRVCTMISFKVKRDPEM